MTIAQHARALALIEAVRERTEDKPLSTAEACRLLNCGERDVRRARDLADKLLLSSGDPFLIGCRPGFWAGRTVAEREKILAHRHRCGLAYLGGESEGRRVPMANQERAA